MYADAIGSASILSRSIMQKSVAQSSMEVGIIAFHEAVTHLKWCSDVFDDLGYKQQGIKIFEDNQAAIRMTEVKQVNFKG